MGSGSTVKYCLISSIKILASSSVINNPMFRFYGYLQNKKIVISDLSIEKIKKKFGIGYEILTSVKEKESIPIILARLQRNYLGFEIVESYVYTRPKKDFLTPEQRKALDDRRKGVPRSPEVRQKISNTLKGRSSFQGKKHTPESKAKIASKKIGNDHVKDTIWAHDPRSDTEIRVRDRKEIPEGFSKGRDFYSTEPGLYYFNINHRRR